MAQQIRLMGNLHVRVQYGDQAAKLALVVVTGNGPSLFGRNWLKYLRSEIAAIGQSFLEECYMSFQQCIKAFRLSLRYLASYGQTGWDHFQQQLGCLITILHSHMQVSHETNLFLSVHLQENV